MKIILTIFLLYFPFSFLVAQDEDSLSKPHTDFNRFNPKTQRIKSYHENGNRKSLYVVTIFNNGIAKKWDENGRLVFKHKTSTAMVSHPKKYKEWKFSYYESGKIKSKSYLSRSGRYILQNQWTKTYDIDGKLLNKEYQYL